MSSSVAEGSTKSAQSDATGSNRPAAAGAERLARLDASLLEWDTALVSGEPLVKGLK